MSPEGGHFRRKFKLAGTQISARTSYALSAKLASVLRPQVSLEKRRVTCS